LGLVVQATFLCAEQCLAAPGLKARLPMEVTWEGQRRASPTKARVLAQRIRAVAAWARLSLPRETVHQQLRVDRALPFVGIRSRVCRRKREVTGACVMPSKPNRRTREAFAVVSYSNMLMLNALAQLLTEKGILTKEEVLGRIEILRKKMPRKSAALEI